jgi:hypothetical protein
MNTRRKVLILSIYGALIANGCAFNESISSVVSTKYAELAGIEVTATSAPTQEVTVTVAPTITQEATLTPAHVSAPVITNLTFPERLYSDTDLGYGEVHFSDLEGDITSAQITVLVGKCMEVDYIALEPYRKLIEGEATEGIFKFEHYCYRCPGAPVEGILMQLQLFDENGFASEPWVYSFLCDDETPYD